MQKGLDKESFYKLLPELQRIHIDLGDKDDAFKMLDSDGNGDVTLQEFYDFLVHLMFENDHVQVMKKVRRGEKPDVLKIKKPFSYPKL
jgi:Ca2+-binding EF-hand superfamily protein